MINITIDIFSHFGLHSPAVIVNEIFIGHFGVVIQVVATSNLSHLFLRVLSSRITIF